MLWMPVLEAVNLPLAGQDFMDVFFVLLTFTDARSAPEACYEELNRQADRFGHCGTDPLEGYKTCSDQYVIR